MKRILYSFAVASLLFSCTQYNDDNFPGADSPTYEEIDTLAYTLTKSDYNSVSSSLTTYLTSDYPDSTAIPTVLDANFPTLDNGSVIQVTFNYYTGENVAHQDSVNKWNADAAYEITSDDYDNMGLSYGDFSSYDAPDDYLPDFLTEKYDKVSDGYSVLVTYKYYASSVTSNIIALYTYKSPSSDASYTLTSSDYDSMGTASGQPGKYDNFAYNIDPNDYLPDFLANKYPDATEGYIVGVTYKYYSNSTTTEETGYYEFNGTTWVKASSWVSSHSITVPSDVTPYSLTESDYDDMGISSFGTADTPDSYLPTFLSVNYPYSKVGDKMVIMYSYSGDETVIEATEYTKTDSAWTATGHTTTTTEQFVKAAGEWNLETATLYTMVKGIDTGDDYQMILDYVSENYGSEYLDSEYNGVYEGETYYGVQSFYGEFRSKSQYWNNDMFDSWENAATAAIGTIFLPQKFPDAAVGSQYIITFVMYDTDSHNYTITFECTAAGTTPTFTLVSGPTLK